TDINQLVIVDISGKVVMTQEVNTTTHQLDIQRLSSGVYSICLSNEARFAYFKFVKL
ncbi:MAG: T9SS type A sorting domain-containing protein, partial [Flavobacteriales bacterium]|nr:T9SS type A sorting domain-containing protein [Flavobacteriales bacterium]